MQSNLAYCQQAPDHSKRPQLAFAIGWGEICRRHRTDSDCRAAAAALLCADIGSQDPSLNFCGLGTGSKFGLGCGLGALLPLILFMQFFGPWLHSSCADTWRSGAGADVWPKVFIRFQWRRDWYYSSGNGVWPPVYQFCTVRVDVQLAIADRALRCGWGCS